MTDSKKQLITLEIDTTLKPVALAMAIMVFFPEVNDARIVSPFDIEEADRQKVVDILKALQISAIRDADAFGETDDMDYSIANLQNHLHEAEMNIEQLFTDIQEKR